MVAQRCGGTAVWCSSEVEVVCGAVRTAAANCRESRYRRSRPRRPRGSCCDSQARPRTFTRHSRACPSTGSLHRPALSTWGKKTRTKFLCLFFSKYDPSARARHYTGLSMQLHHFHHRPPRTKGSGQRNLNYHISLPGLHHLAGVGINALAGHQARRRIGAVRSAEEQDVRLRPGGRCGGRLRACDQVAHATRERWIAGRAGGWHLWMA